MLYIKDEKPPRVKLTLSGVPRAKVELEMACNIVKYKGAARSDEWDSGLQQTAEQLISNEMARVFNICRELNSDAFGFGEYASTQFSDIVSWEGMTGRANILLWRRNSALSWSWRMKM